MCLSEDKAKVNQAMESLIENEIERRIKNIPIHLVIDGELVDMAEYSVNSGEVYIELQTPFFYPETGKVGFVTQETPAQMAG